MVFHNEPLFIQKPLLDVLKSTNVIQLLVLTEEYDLQENT